jgi:hypothetical protein
MDVEIAPQRDALKTYSLTIPLSPFRAGCMHTAIQTLV